jgi:RNA polymerase sigma factor (TIGR02999 family)
VDEPDDITSLLRRVDAGERAAVDSLLPHVYDKLRSLAHRQLAGDGAHTLNTTALVNEAWLALAERDGGWRDRAHFLGYAAMTMRHILVDHARRKHALKRGGDQLALDWDAHELPVEEVAGEMVALDAALDRLAEVDARLVRVVELRFFAGLSVEEAGEVLGITARSVVRDWKKARLFLHAAIDAAR